MGKFNKIKQLVGVSLITFWRRNNGTLEVENDRMHLLF